MKTLQNTQAIKLIHKLIEDVSQNGIIINTVVDDLKALRPFTIQEELPLLAKATRLSAEHIEENETFAIPIPQDEPIEGEEVEVIESDPKESFHYFLCLIRDIDKKVNEEELREYVKAFNEY